MHINWSGDNIGRRRTFRLEPSDAGQLLTSCRVAVCHLLLTGCQLHSFCTHRHCIRSPPCALWCFSFSGWQLRCWHMRRLPLTLLPHRAPARHARAWSIFYHRQPRRRRCSPLLLPQDRCKPLRQQLRGPINFFVSRGAKLPSVHLALI